MDAIMLLCIQFHLQKKNNKKTIFYYISFKQLKNKFVLLYFVFLYITIYLFSLEYYAMYKNC